MLGPAKGLTEVARENVDIGRCSIPKGMVGAMKPDCEPCISALPPNIFTFGMTVFRGAFGIIPYMLPVVW